MARSASTRTRRPSLAERDPFRIGLIAIAVALVLGGGVVLLSVAQFGTASYTAVLPHTAGLRTGEDVQVHGVPVGEVTDIELGDTDVLVTFTVEDDIELGSQTTASVKVATLLGTHFLDVAPAGDGTLADGRIPLERTSVPSNLQDVLDGGTQRLTELDPVLLARALTQASRTLSASSDEIGPALEGVGRLSELVTTREGQTRDLLQAARSVSDQLDRSSDDLIGLMKATNLVVGEVTARRAAIDLLLTETSRLSTALADIVTRSDDAVGPAFRDLDTALASLNQQKDALTRTLEIMEPAVRYIANATGNGPWADLYVKDPAIPADDLRCQAGGC
ncbi:MCE family protein [Nocardioides sp.]|uniref:MCE family protein n=1 Tax=Nocardioides sp. TaxID=35761 RepID=UPI003511EB99